MYGLQYTQVHNRCLSSLPPFPLLLVPVTLHLCFFYRRTVYSIAPHHTVYSVSYHIVCRGPYCALRIVPYRVLRTVLYRELHTVPFRVPRAVLYRALRDVPYHLQYGSVNNYK